MNIQRESDSCEQKPVERRYIRSNSLFLTPTIEEETILAKSYPYV